MLKDVKKAKNATSFTGLLAGRLDECYEKHTHNSSTPGGRSSPTIGHNSVLSISSCRLIPQPPGQQPQKAAPEQLVHSRQYIWQKVCRGYVREGFTARSDDCDPGAFSIGKRPTAGHHRDVVMRLCACSGRVIASVGRYKDVRKKGCENGRGKH